MNSVGVKLLVGDGVAVRDRSGVYVEEARSVSGLVGSEWEEGFVGVEILPLQPTIANAAQRKKNMVFFILNSFYLVYST